MRRLGIVPCSKEKIWDLQPVAGAVPASRAYRSRFHQLAVAYVRSLTSDWLILSAKYGLLAPNQLIPGPYDISFTRPQDPTVSMSLLRQQAAAFARFGQVICVCPRLYGEKIEQAFAGYCPVVHPLRGVGGWGSMHSWLQRQLNEKSSSNSKFS